LTGDGVKSPVSKEAGLFSCWHHFADKQKAPGMIRRLKIKRNSILLFPRYKIFSFLISGTWSWCCFLIQVYAFHVLLQQFCQVIAANVSELHGLILITLPYRNEPRPPGCHRIAGQALKRF